MNEQLGLSTYTWNNNIKSLLLVAMYPCLLLMLVAAFFYLVAVFNQTPEGVLPPKFIAAFAFADYHPAGKVDAADFASALSYRVAPYVFAVAGLWILIGFAFNDSLIHMATGAKPVTRTAQPELYNLLENLCISRGMRMPSLYMIDTPVKNAFASGLTEKSFAVTVTRGLVETLKKDELEAVLAHELSHIINRDVRLLVVTVLFGGFLSFFADMAWRSMEHVVSDDDSRKAFPFMLLLALLLSFGYLIALLFRFALSRRREFLADAGAVVLTKNPAGLIRALQKIQGDSEMKGMSTGTRAMLIENPPGFFSWFDTHPPVAARIAVLRRLGGGVPSAGHTIIPTT